MRFDSGCFGSDSHSAKKVCAVVTRWDEKAGLRRDAEAVFSALHIFAATMDIKPGIESTNTGIYQSLMRNQEAKKALAGVAAGTGIAVLAANVLTWLGAMPRASPHKR